MKLTSNTKRKIFLSCGASAAAMFAAGAAMAQGAETEDRVTVTGTRIASPELTSPSPLQTVDAEFIEDQGIINIQDALQYNPSFGAPGESRATSNGDVTNAGTATVNLRNLGANRTLVLVDGQRMVAGVPGTAQVDLSMVPTDFIERVEVLTGGASAVYGSDAVAGVVNLIYKKDFEGLILNAQGGISEKGDDIARKFSLTAGHNFADGDGNFMVNATYSKQGVVRASERARSADDFYSAGLLTSPRDPSLLFEPTLNRSTVHPGGTVSVGGVSYTFDENGNALPWDINNQDTRFNRNDFGSDRAIVSPLERFTFASRASYEINDMVEVFVEGNYGKSSSRSFYEPHPLIANSNVIGVGANINVENWLTNPADGTTVLVRNPFVPDIIYNGATDTNNDGLRDVAFSKRMVEFGNRETAIDRQLFRIALGFEGDLGENWSYDAYYTYGQTTLSGRMDGLYVQSNFLSSLTAGADFFDFDGDGDTAEAICVNNTDRRQYGCDPANVFGIGLISQDALDYISGAAIQNSTQDMHVISGNISGTLLNLPAGPLQVAGGLEYREESSEHLFDPLSNRAQNGYVQQNNTVGSFDVKEFYGEVSIPLLADMPMFHMLSVRGAARRSDYSTVGAFWAYNGGVEWSPVPDLRIRGVYAHAVRAPNIGELFRAVTAGITSINDPCNGVSTSDTSAVAQNCLADPGVAANAAANGGTVTLIQSDFQGVPQLSAPNPNIREETATTWTIGAVYTPEQVPGLAFSVDYYNIELDDAITSANTTTILNKCYQEGVQEFCDAIMRRTQASVPYSAGSVEQIRTGLVNSGGTWAKGLDFTANYSADIAGGTGSLGLSFTRLLDQGNIPLVGEPVDNYAGEVGYPKNKGYVTVGYDIGSFGATLTGNYIGTSYLDDVWIENNFGTDVDMDYFKVKSRFYTDIQLKYTIQETYDLYVGVNNLLDTNPPPIWSGLPGGAGDGQTNLALYDGIGRRFYFGVRASF